MKKNPILLTFAHQSGIWQHAFPEALMLDPLKKKFDIHYITCNDFMRSFCITMAGNGLTFDSSKEKKEIICSNCKAYRNILTDNFNFNNEHLEKYITDSDEETIRTILASKQNLIELKIDHIEIGKVALYEILLEYKKLDFDLNAIQHAHFLSNLKNCLYTYYAMQRIFDKIQPDKVQLYNTYYSVNRIVYLMAQQRGIEIYAIHAGYNWSNRLEKMILANNSVRDYKKVIMNEWEKYKEYPIIDSKNIQSTTEHFMHIIKSKTVFNYGVENQSSFDFYKKYPQAKNKKVFLATPSSLDEFFAASVANTHNTQTEVFSRQLHWIEWLIDFFKDKKEFFLIIRVHPREFPNRRSNLLSDNAKNLQKKFKNLPSNIVPNFPDENISLFNLAQEVDVLLNGHSSSSLDLLLLGIPVVIFDKVKLYFPLSLHYYCESQSIEGYIKKIYQALEEGWNIKYSIYVYRWLYFTTKSEFDLSNNINWYREEKIVEQKKIESKRRENHIEKDAILDFISENRSIKNMEPYFNRNNSKQLEKQLIYQELNKLFCEIDPTSKLYKHFEQVKNNLN